LHVGGFIVYKIIVNVETLEQISQFTYLGCSVSYLFSNDVEPKLAKFLQLIGTRIKRTSFRKVRTETILKLYNTYFYLHLYMGQKDKELKRQN